MTHGRLTAHCKGNQDRNREAGIEAEARRTTAYWCVPMVCLASIRPQWTATSIVNQENAPETCPGAKLMEVFFQLMFPSPRWPELVSS